MAAAELDGAVAHERGGLAGTAQPERLELEQDDVGEAVVHLEEVDVVGPDARHRERLRRGGVQADAEEGRAARDVVGGGGGSFGGAPQDHGGMGGGGRAPAGGGRGGGGAIR